MILLTIFQNLWNGWHLYWRVISVLLFLFSSCIFLLSFTLYAKDFNFKKAFRHYEDNIINPSSNIQWIFSLRDWIYTHTCSPGHIGTRNCVFCAIDNKDCQRIFILKVRIYEVEDTFLCYVMNIWLFYK